MEASYGGALYLFTTADLTVTDSSCTNCKVIGGEGGFVYTEPNSKVTVRRSSFANCQAELGGVFRVRLGSSITATSSTFTDNLALHHGGAWDIGTNSVVVFDRVTGLQSRAPNGHGGFAHIRVGSTISILDFTIDGRGDWGRRTAYHGGVLSGSEWRSLTVKGSNFRLHRVAHGGFMTHWQRSYAMTILFENCLFEYNYAWGVGVVHLWDGQRRAQVSFVGCTFNYDGSSWGGAIFMDNMNKLSIVDSDFLGCTGYWGAGSIFSWNAEAVEINASSVTSARTWSNRSGAISVTSPGVPTTP